MYKYVLLSPDVILSAPNGDIADGEVYPGIPKLLRELKARGLKTALVSAESASSVDRLLKRTGLRRYFDVVTLSGAEGKDVNKNELLAEALRQLYGENAIADAKELSVMLCGSCSDIELAGAEGVDAIAVSYGRDTAGELAGAGADAIAGSVDELKELLLGGVGKELFIRKQKREMADAAVSRAALPGHSPLKALYILAPFVIYFAIMQSLYILITGGVSRISTPGGEQAAWMSANSRLLSVLINSLVMLLTALFLWLIYRRREYLHFMPLWEPKEAVKKSICIILLAIVLSALLNEALTALAQLIVPRILDEEAAQAFFDAAAYDRSTPLLAGILLYVLISPLLEELVFRWLLCERIRRVFSENITIVLTALFFGFYHGNILQGVYAFLMGLVLGRLRFREDALLAPLIFHMSANAFIFLASFAQL